MGDFARCAPQCAIVHERMLTAHADGRGMVTPFGNLFCVPNEAMARAVAGEWASQEDRIKPGNDKATMLCNCNSLFRFVVLMPLMTLVSHSCVVPLCLTLLFARVSYRPRLRSTLCRASARRPSMIASSS